MNQPSEKLRGELQRPTLRELLTYNNPNSEAYKNLIYEEQYNDQANMNPGFGHGSAWLDLNLGVRLPDMGEGEQRFLQDRHFIFSRMDFIYLSNLYNGIYFIQSGQIQELRLKPLMHYEEAVKDYFQRQKGEAGDPSSAGDTLTSVLANSDHGVVQEFNNLADEFNLDIERICREKDIDTAQKYIDTFKALFGREAVPKPGVCEQFFTQKLGGRILVDLGGGDGLYMSRISQKFNAAMCVNVEKFIGLGELNPYEPLYEEMRGDTKFMQVKADMLDFLSKLRSGSVNVAINGIDLDLITNMAYHKAVAEEVERAALQGGVVFGYNSTVLNILEERKKLQRKICTRLGSRGTYIFEKR